MRTIFRLAVQHLICGLSVSTAITSILLTATLLLAVPQTARAEIYTVCPLPAVCDYQSPEVAVNAPVVVDGDTIDIVASTYVLGTTLQVDKSITILGHGSVFDANGIRAIDVINAATNLSLTNVTIRNGQADTGSGGGALRVSGGASVTVIGGIFEDNQAELGGAVHNFGSNVTIRESVFSGNRATAGEGGAVLTDSGGSTTLIRTEIDGNTASVAGGGLAVGDNNSQLNFVASTISNNAALTTVQTVSNTAISGTTISCGESPLGQTFLADAPALSAFEFNIRLNGPVGDSSVIPSDLNIVGQVRQGGPAGPVIATASAFAPGGVWPGGSTQTLVFNLDQAVALIPNDTYAIESFIAGAYSIFISPGNDYPGGDRYDCDGSFSVGSDFFFRTFGGSPGDGGGIYASAAGFAGLFNSTVSGNLGDGAVAASGGSVTTLFSTITNNSGNGLTAQPGAPGGLVFFTATIIAENGGNDCAGSNFTSSGFNLIGDDTNCVFTPFTGDLIGTGVAPIDPLLGPLQDNGGLTATHAIDPNSPALDGAGSDLAPPCADATDDQRGVARPGGPACDIGAFELGPAAAPGPLQTLITAAAPGAIIIVPDGIYTEQITIGDGKTLRGSGPDNVVINANGLGVSAIIATGDFMLEGIRVTGGSSVDNGGGIIASTAGTDIILFDVVFDNNDAVLDGGAIYLANGTLAGTSVTFTNNSAGGNGGSILSALGVVDLQGVVIEGGSATSGGAIHNGSGSQLLIGTAVACAGMPVDVNTPILNIISGNSATTLGGAIAGGTIVIANTRLTGNSAGQGGATDTGSGGSLNIDCSILDANLALSGSGGAVNNSNASINVTLFEGNTSATSGGAFSGNSAAISNSIFRLNQAGEIGGAIATVGPLTSTGNEYDANHADFGGAIGIDGNLFNAADSIDDLFTSNTATHDGGAIYEFGSNLNVRRGVFQSNTAGDSNGGFAGDGGAIYSGRSAVISESMFSVNRAVEGDGVPGRGGAIFNDGTLTLIDSTVDTSSAGTGGGLYNNVNGIAAISGTTFRDNNADGSGTAGGAIGGAGTIEIVNSTLSGNTSIGGSGNGGGIGLVAGTAMLNNVTLAFNAASGLGGPFYADTGALISLSNSLLSDNTGGGTNCSTVLSLGYNLFQSAPCPATASDITGEPLIGFLASNGGPTQTHALAPASPARDAADPGRLVIELTSALSAGQLSFNGVALESGGNLIPVSGEFVAGSIFASAPDEGSFDLTGSFSTRFSFQITDPVAWAGAPGEPSGDGFTFAIAANPAVLGEPGGRLGVATSPGPLGTVSVEFDTFPNGGDISTNAIGINVGGAGDGQSVISAAQAAIPGGFDDGNVWMAWIEYRADTHRLDVRVAADGVRPDLPQLVHTVDIASEVGATGYYGFTGGTGLAHATHAVTDWEFFITNCPSFDQRGVARPQSSSCDIGAYEAGTIPLELDGPVVLSTVTLDQGLSDGTSYPGVVDVPIIDIPIEKLTGDTFNSPAAAPLGSFPLGSFPIGSIELRNSPLGSFPLGSFPIGSFPLGSFPLGSFPLASIPLLSEGGWTEILSDIPELAGAPLQTVTLEQLLRLNPLPNSVASITLRDLAIEGSPLASLSLQGLSLGDTTVADLDQWLQNADSSGADTVCETLTAEDPAFSDCGAADTLLGLEVKGAPVSALSLSSLPLGSFPIGSFPLGSFPIGSFPLGSFPIGSFPLGSFPLGSFPLGSFPLGSFPLSSFNLLATPLGSLPLGSFPIGSFPLGSFEIDGKSFCEFYDEQAIADGSKTCAQLNVNPGTDSLADLVEALQDDDPAGSIGSTPLGSFPLGSFPIGSFPIGSFGLDMLSSPPLSLLTLEDFDGCQELDGTADCSTIPALSETSSLIDVATEYGTLAASPLGSFPLGSLNIADLPLGSFPLGSFEVNGAPLGSFPLGSFDLIGSPLGSFPLGSFSSLDAIIDDPTGICAACQTLSDAARAGVISASATLADLELSSEFAATTLGEVLDAMTLAILYGPGTLASIEDTGNLTLGQLLIALMLKTGFPWETIPLDQLDVQEFSADNFIAYVVDIPLTGTELEPFAIAVTLAGSFLYVEGSALLDVAAPGNEIPSSSIDDPAIVDNGDGTQTLTFNLILGGFSNNMITFTAVPALALGDYTATATVVVGGDAPVLADDSNSALSVIPYPLTDISDPVDALTAPVDVLLLGFINARDDKDFFLVAPPAAGNRVAVFMSNPAGDNDLIMYEPLSTVEAKGQDAEAPPLDSVPFEDDGIDYEGNLTEEPNALEDMNLANEPLASISTNRGDLDESVSAIAGDTAPFTIQVSGYNGAISDQPYTLRVKVTPQVSIPQCTARSWPGSASSTVVPAGSWMPDTNAVFLVNGARLAASDPGGQVSADAALTAINGLINGPNITNGVVVDVSTIFGVDYTAWDLNPCDVDAANDIVNAITKYLEEQRVGSPNLTYVTIVGSDEVIPFARKPDETSISNESTFAGEFTDNAMFGALVTRHFLSDDTYGDIDPIPWLDRYLNVPELGVGRLLESAEDIQAAAGNYIAFGGVLDPQTALSAGYDFIADASEDIDDTLNAYGPVLGFSVVPALIDMPGVLPDDAWTKDDFLEDTAVYSTNPVDLVSFNMHFDFDEALPSSGDAAGNYTDNLISVADFDGTDLAGGIWFTVGCHSGSNVPDVSVVGGAPSQDWAQTFSHLGALFLAQNAYGLGDTEAIALTERLLAIFARNLNGSLTVGQAHAFAKQQYFADLGLYGEYDYKALQAATLFGLPMYRYGNGAMVADPLPPVLPVVTDPISGLASASWSLSDTGITETTNTSKGDVFSVDGDVQFVHFRPLQPIVRRDVTSSGGEIASGAFLTALITEDKKVMDIAFARPVIALGEIEAEIETDEVVFPAAFTNIANFKAPPPTGGPFTPRQQLNVIVGQFTSPMDGGSSGTERLFRSFDAQVFYRPAPVMVGDDFIRPELDNVQASVVGPSGAQQAAFSVDVTDEGTVLRVAVLYLQSLTGIPAMGNWVLVDLVRGGAGGNTWTGGGSVDASVITNGQVDFMVQAVDSNGNVANSTFKGLFYIAEELPPPPAPGGGPGTIGVVVTVGDDVVDPGDWITTDPVKVVITDQDAGTRYEYSVDFAGFVPLTPAGFLIAGDGVHIVTVQEFDGSNPVTFVILIDTTPPQVLITTPAAGAFVVQGMEPAAGFDCLDAGSGIDTCVGTVPDGAPVPAATTGSQSFVVTARDNAQPDPTVAENVYFVVQPLEVGGPIEPTAISAPVTITASATDLDEFTETVTIDWGDGGPLETVDLGSTGVSNMSRDHIYPAAGVYQVTVTVDYEGQFTQAGVVDLLLVFDPNNGFVTGGGWINSPLGAYTPNDSDDADVTGKTLFNLSLKYRKGRSVPDGSTNFRFAAGDLVFNATAFDWMIISGARARFEGQGTVNGGDDLYKFLVTALDADISGAGISQDKIRIRIWQENTGGAEIVLYDSGLGADDASGSGGATPLGGGSITIHKARKK